MKTATITLLGLLLLSCGCVESTYKNGKVSFSTKRFLSKTTLGEITVDTNNVIHIKNYSNDQTSVVEAATKGATAAVIEGLKTP